MNVSSGSTSRYVSLKRNFVRFYGCWRELSEELRAAILDLIAEPYLRLGYPTEQDFATAFAVLPGTPAFQAAWAREVSRRRDLQRISYGDDDRVYVLCANDQSGRLVALATIMVVPGKRDTPVADAIGDPESSLPTMRMLQFTCGAEAGLAPEDTPERRIAELGRMCVLQRPELLALVGAGTLTLNEAAYVEAHAFNEMFAMPYLHDQEHPDPPLAYLGNTAPWMISALERRGLDLRRLYLAAGAAPTPRVLGGGQSTSAYFSRWRASLATVVPAPVLAGGTAAAIRHLVQENFTDWDRLALSLPFWFLNTPPTAEAMAKMAHAFGVVAGPRDRIA